MSSLTVPQDSHTKLLVQQMVPFGKFKMPMGVKYLHNVIKLI